MIERERRAKFHDTLPINVSQRCPHVIIYFLGTGTCMPMRTEQELDDMPEHAMQKMKLQKIKAFLSGGRTTGFIMPMLNTIF